MESEDGAGCANPLYLSFIKEEWDLAKLRNSKSESVKAYASLSSFPLELSHPCETKQLSGIGDKIVNQLTEKLRAHCDKNGLRMPEKPRGKNRKRLSSDIVDLPEAAPCPKKPRKQKPYVPGRRTGPYAILLALSSLSEDSMQSLTKEQVIHMAQQHCDSSFTDPDKGSHYTAWNSMRTLIDKDLVHERGRPRRNYALSEEGWETARRIRSFEKGQTLLIEETQINDDRETRDKGGQRIRKDDDGVFLSIDQLNETFAQRDGDHANRKRIPNALAQTLPRQSLTEISPNSIRTKVNPTLMNKAKGNAISEVVELFSSPEPEERASRKIDADHAQSILRPPPGERDQVTTSQYAKLIPEATASSSLENGLPNFEPLIIQPGTFEIKLVLDNREIRSKECRDSIINGLSDLGTPAISRALSVGDAFWVARLHNEDFLPSHHEQGREVALDWIVERKRRDDLVGSIKDGRFNEQKFRLRRSGVRNVIYVLEDYRLSEDNERANVDKIDSAIASMQVVNDFFVKRTQGNDDTIRYLSQVTRYLKEEYESKPLYLIPSSVLAPSMYLPLLEHLRSDPAHIDRTYAVTMTSFDSLASKTDILTLRDVFLKMLMCTKGLTGDKAIAIQKIWPTPVALIEAYEGCEDQKQRETLVEKSLGKIVGRGSVKSALSAKMSQIWA